LRNCIFLFLLTTAAAHAQGTMRLCDTILAKDGPTQYSQMAVKAGQVHQGDWHFVPGERNWIYVWVDFKPPWPETYPSFLYQVNTVNEDGSETDWTHPEINTADHDHAVDGFGVPPTPGKYSVRLVDKRTDKVVLGPVFFTVAP